LHVPASKKDAFSIERRGRLPGPTLVGESVHPHLDPDFDRAARPAASGRRRLRTRHTGLPAVLAALILLAFQSSPRRGREAMRINISP